MKFIVGIGNPEKQYEKTRHNIGFRVLDRWCAASSGAWREKKKYRSQVCSLETAQLFKPETYVNNTGETVSVLRQKKGVLPADFLVVCDDVNLSFGKLRLRDSGSAGGHHGLESVIRALDTEHFARLRVGVGGMMMPKGDLTDYVLGLFTAQEQKELSGVLDKAMSVCQSWVNDGFHGALNCLSRHPSIKEE